MRGGYKYKVVERILRHNGWECSRHNSHCIWMKDGRHISLPKGRDICIPMWKRLVKENDINIHA